jgi:hypothetical protein
LEQINRLNNFIRVGYGKDLAPYDPSQDFYIKFPILAREPLEPFEESIVTAKKISAYLGPDLTLCLSGGLDSEAMALAFLAADIPFNVTTLRFANGLNAEDTDCAKEFCDHHRIVQNFIDLDIVDFLEHKKFLSHFRTYHCTSVETAVQAWFADQLKQPFVWAGEIMRLFINGSEIQIQAVGEAEGNMHRFVEMKGIKAVPNFHFFTPEMAWSFFKKSLLYKNNFYQNDHMVEFYDEKLEFYRACGFPIEENSARKIKLHGFEGVKRHFDELHQKKGLPSYNEVYRIPYQHLKSLSTQIEISKNDEIAKNILHLSSAVQK